MKEVALIGFAQTLFFSLLIVTKKEKETKDYLLIIFCRDQIAKITQTRKVRKRVAGLSVSASYRDSSA